MTTQLTSIYPVLMCEELEPCARALCDCFELERAFENDWYISLYDPQEPKLQIALLQPGHPSIPESLRDQRRATGLLVNIEVRDVDAVWHRVKEHHDRGNHKIELLLDLRDEPWGQRHFIVRLADQIVLDVITPTTPSEEYMADYKVESPA